MRITLLLIAKGSVEVDNIIVMYISLNSNVQMLYASIKVIVAFFVNLLLEEMREKLKKKRINVRIKKLNCQSVSLFWFTFI